MEICLFVLSDKQLYINLDRLLGDQRLDGLKMLFSPCFSSLIKVEIRLKSSIHVD